MFRGGWDPGRRAWDSFAGCAFEVLWLAGKIASRETGERAGARGKELCRQKRKRKHYKQRGGEGVEIGKELPVRN